jgi:hypothetical protein
VEVVTMQTGAPGWSVRDVGATLVFLLIVVPYAGYLLTGRLPYVEDPRGMAAVGLVLGVVATSVVLPFGFRGAAGRAAVGACTVSALLGVATVVWGETAAGEPLLAAFVAGIVLTWLLTVGVHAGLLSPGGRRPAPR